MSYFIIVTEQNTNVLSLNKSDGTAARYWEKNRKMRS